MERKKLRNLDKARKWAGPNEEAIWNIHGGWKMGDQDDGVAGPMWRWVVLHCTELLQEGGGGKDKKVFAPPQLLNLRTRQK